MTAGTVPWMTKISGRLSLTADTAFFAVPVPPEAAPFAFTPGQFVELSIPAGGEVPVSIAGSPADLPLLELCVRSVGRVTKLLHTLQEGEAIGLRGPFGTGFPVEKFAGSDVLLLAGGLGIAPLRSLLRHLLSRRNDYGEITLMYGAREPSEMLFRHELAELSCRRDLRLLLTVDFFREGEVEGPVCRVGMLPSLLAAVPHRFESTFVAACGPPAMYRCLLNELLPLGFSPEKIFLSLERRMKCGGGRCGHCAVGTYLCCTDGPVFRYSRIAETEGAI